MDISAVPFVNWYVSVSYRSNVSPLPDDDAFARFFHDALPVVFGYVLRLCGGDRDEAWDVTQDAWLTFVREVNRDEGRELPSIGWLIRVARSRYLDRWRRAQNLSDRLRLVWAFDRDRDEPELDREVLDRLEELEPSHRVVLTLLYVDDLPIAEVARLMGLSRSGTYAVSARARDELRMKLVEAADV